MLRVELGIEAQRRVVAGDVLGGVHVEGRDAGVGPRGHVTLLVLVAREEVDLVVHDRAAQVGSQLLFLERRDLVGEEVPGVEAIVAQETEGGALEGVRARLRDGVDHDPRDAAVLDIEAVREHLELGDVLLAVPLVGAAAALAADIHAVHLVLRHVAAGRARLDLPGVAPRPRDQRDEVQPVAAVQGQVLDLGGLDPARESGLGGLDERRLALNGHGLLDRGELHPERQDGRLPDREREPLLD